jgi:hypothetical protein
MNHQYNTFLNKNLLELIDIYQKEPGVETDATKSILTIKIEEDDKSQKNIKVFTQSFEKLSIEQINEIKLIKNHDESLLNMDRHVLTCKSQTLPFPIKEMYVIFSDNKDEFILRGYQNELASVQGSLPIYTYEFETFLEKLEDKYQEESEEQLNEYEDGGIPEKPNFKGKWNNQNTVSGQKFLKICRLATLPDDDPECIFSKFRSEMDYQNILIGGTEDRAKLYQDLLEEDLKNVDIRSKLIECDRIGGPPISSIGISVYTLRTYQTYKDLIRHFGDLSGMRILEIGGGHGGLCHLISLMSPNYSSYTLMDLPLVNKLAKKYLDAAFNDLNEKPIRYMSTEELIPRKYDLVISEYSFSELDPYAQKTYFEKVIRYSSKAYLAMNVWDTRHKLYLKTYLEKIYKNVEECGEEPKSDYPNYIWICKL